MKCELEKSLSFLYGPQGRLARHQALIRPITLSGYGRCLPCFMRPIG